jgi:tetratricopeptide (TPR) repeat protein
VADKGFILNELKRYEEALAAEEQAIKLNPGLLVFLIRGKDSGRAAWHYILVAQDKLSLFKQKLGTGNIDVSEYCKILYSGWGENPPPEIVETVKNQYS